ncbi:MAG TPA: phosphatase PAP2 family protein [Gaiellaceae bacterium]|nr:phosphatase PAP2 family protein [Gaiellaceae bacterium]
MVQRRHLRVGAPIVWLLLSAIMVATVGVPTSHDLVFGWFALGILSVCITDLRARIPRFVRDWSPFMLTLFVYDRLRGYADGMLFHPREVPQIKVEAALFGKPIPTVWLQSHLWHGPNDLHWWDYATWFVYLTHFLGTLIVAAILWTWAHQHFARFATMVCVLAFAAFTTYVLYPAVPPWMAAQQGAIGEANRTIKVTWPHVPIAHYGSLFEKGQHYANNVAAMPSLHAGYALLLSLFLWRLVPRWTRPILALYPFAMAFSLVYGAEHYAVDCIAGWVYAGATFASVELVFAWRARRAQARARVLEPAFVD